MTASLARFVRRALAADRRGSPAGSRGVLRRTPLAPVGVAATSGPAGRTDQAIGGGVFAGITHAFRSPYLVNVSLFLLLFAITSTFLYFEQAAIVSRSFTDRSAQTAFFATIDLAVNILTLIVQLFLTGRIVRGSASG